MLKVWTSALLSVASIIACCPTPQVVAPVETPTVSGVAIGGACGPAVGDCAAEGYCAFAADNACGVSAAGVCTERPRGCFKDCPGVCGCDGVRHCNACVAQQRGVSVRHDGACDESPGNAPAVDPAVTP